MLLPIATRNAIYEHLFQEGVMTACKDVRPLSKHPRLDIRNLYVVKTLKSLHSRGFVREQFAWRTYYWFLTNEGIAFLREVLHLPSDIIPATLKPAIKDIRQMPPGIEPPQPRGQDGRMAFRQGRVAPGPMAYGKDVPEKEINFRGGFGRGKPL